MIRVQIDVNDLTHRLTLKLALEHAGHAVQEDAEDAQVVIVDDTNRALLHARRVPTLVLTPLHDIPNAVALMRQGIYGYIVMPLQQGEADIRVRQAVAAPPPRSEQVELVPLEEVERRHIMAVLRHCRGNRALAARTLKIGRNTLWRKLKKWGEATEGDDDDGGGTP